jgi:protocatechuate 3,4-dioxygenase alpha subunit
MPATTSSQTIGPYWHLLDDKAWSDLTRFGAGGEVITVEGCVYDGAGALIGDACIEIWQSSPASAQFPGFGRAATDASGKFRFTTLKPQPVPGPGNTLQAPHIAVTVFARGLLVHLTTRLYFKGDPANENDPILARIEPPQRRAALLARETAPAIWQFDIHLQGAAETPFFEI